MGVIWSKLVIQEIKICVKKRLYGKDVRHSVNWETKILKREPLLKTNLLNKATIDLL